MRTITVRPRPSDGDLPPEPHLAMQARAGLHEPVGSAACSAFDAGVASFDLADNRSEQH